MVDLSGDIRLAVDSGEVVVGSRDVLRTIKKNTSKLVITAKNIDEKNAMEIKHLANISNLKVLDFDGSSTELGSICGKPFSVSILSVINQGNSKILDIANANSEVI